MDEVDREALFLLHAEIAYLELTSYLPQTTE